MSQSATSPYSENISFSSSFLRAGGQGREVGWAAVGKGKVGWAAVRVEVSAAGGDSGGDDDPAAQRWTRQQAAQAQAEAEAEARVEVEALPTAPAPAAAAWTAAAWTLRRAAAQPPAERCAAAAGRPGERLWAGCCGVLR